MMSSVDIGSIGERIVAQELVSKGYRTNVDTKLPGSTDIEAKSSAANLLVQVKTAVSPNQPASLSSDEERNIKARATKISYQAWEAKVQLNESYKLIGKIVWRKLS